MTDSESIHQALTRSATIVTSNARAARRLQLDYGRTQRALGHSAWPTPPIFDWRSWMNDLWEQFSFSHPGAPVRLTPMQEIALWKTSLGSDAHSVVSPDSLATLAQQAYALLCAYDAHAARRNAWDPADAERFRHWADAFDRTCESRSWLSASRIEEHLTVAARAGELTLPTEIHFVGFDRITPAQQSFLDTLEACGVFIHLHHVDSQQAAIRAFTTVSERAEIEACAHWLREQLETAPESRIAVLCNNVEQRRGEIDRIFRRILTPEIELSPDAPSPRAIYEFTLGNPLATIPVIRAAMLTLQWLVEPLPLESASSLLLSGYLAGSNEELLACAPADALLRKHTSLSPLIPLSRAIASNGAQKTLPAALRRRLQDALIFATQNHFSENHRHPSAWGELFRAVLKKSGWPGFRTADTIQFQAQHRWDKLLDDLALLDLISSPISCAEFLRLLMLHAQQTLFAPESLDAPIQIMGPMESAGQSFATVWFLGATDEQWPATGRPHPLIPATVQHASGMPHADTDDDFTLAQSVTQRILSSASYIVFSRARRNKDGELRPSPIVTALTQEENVSEMATNTANSSEYLETWQESAPIPFTNGASAGGSALLRDQAACPFRAFAAHRLHAEEFFKPEWGLTAKDRGILLHEVLRRFWTETEPRHIANRDALLQAIADDELPSILAHHIDAAFLSELRHDADEPWLVAYLDAEKHRLTSLLTTWLTQESQRQPFTVEDCEKPLSSIAVGPLQFNLRVDRIDLLSDGSRLLIDYKTGKVTSSAWDGDRPDEPQLPLYAVHGNVENLSGLLFAQIRSQDLKFSGHVRDARTQLFADLEDKNPLVKFPYTDTMHDAWEFSLSSLASEFASGEARVQPKHGEKTCEHCPLPGLCRIHEINASAERSLWEADGDEGQESEDA